MFRKEDLIVNYFCPKTTADSQIADIPFMESETEESFQHDLNDWLYNFAEDYWSNDPGDDDDEIYVEERNEDGEYIILASIKKNLFEDYDIPSTEDDEPFDNDKEPNVDWNGDWN